MNKPLDPMSVERTEMPSASYVLRRRYGPARHVITVASWVMAISMLLQPVVVWAGTVNWDGSDSAAWYTGANWDGNAKPGSSDNAVFPASVPGTGSTITLGSGETALNLTFNNSYTLSGGDLTLGGSGSISVSSDKTATISSSIIGTSAITKTGDGTVTINNATLPSFDTITLSGGKLNLATVPSSVPTVASGTRGFWLDASTLSGADNTTVASWNWINSSGGSAAMTLANSPKLRTGANGMGTGQLPVVRFTGGYAYGSFAQTGSQSTAFVVVREPSVNNDSVGLITAAKTGAGLSDYNNNYTYTLSHGNGANAGKVHMEYNNNNPAGEYSVVANRPFIMSATANLAGGVNYWYVRDGNDTTGGSRTTGIYAHGQNSSLSTDVLGVGTRYVNGAYAIGLTGDIGEVLVYTSVLSPADRILIENYLYNKWINGTGGAVNRSGTHVNTTATSTLDLGAAAVDHTLGKFSVAGGATLTIANAKSVTLAGISGTSIAATGSGVGAISGTATLKPAGNITASTSTSLSITAPVVIDTAGTRNVSGNVTMKDLDLSAVVGTVSANPLAISNTLKVKDGNGNIVTGTYTAGGIATSFNTSGSDLASNSVGRTLTLSGGTLKLGDPGNVSSGSLTITNTGTTGPTGSTVTNTTGDIALAGNGATAFAVNEYGSPHTIAHLNDGVYGNSYSWLPRIDIRTLGKPGIDLPGTGLYNVTQIAYGRSNTGDYSDRWTTPNNVYYTRVTSGINSSLAITSDPTTGWALLGSATRSDAKRNVFDITQGTSSHVSMTGLMIDVPNNDMNSANAIDEIEIYGAAGIAPTPPLNLPNTHIAADASSTLDLGASGADHTLGGLTLTGVTLTIKNANSVEFGNITASGTAGLAFDTANGIKLRGTSGTATVDVASSGTLTLDGAKTTVTAATALAKTGGGTLTLTGTHTYAVAIQVSGGTLLVNGTLNSQTSAVTVGGASATVGGTPTLGGTGTINRPVVIAAAGGGAAGHLAPGTSIGTLTIGNTLTLAGVGDFEIDKAGGTLTNDQVIGLTAAPNVTGATLNVTITGNGFAHGDKWKLFTWTGVGSIAGTIATAPANVPNGFKWENFGTTGAPNYINPATGEIELEAVPGGTVIMFR